MTDREKLEENFEDALFALLMDDIAREEGERLLRENEALQADPNAPRPDEERCMRTIRRAAARHKMAAAARKLGKASGRAAAVVLVFVMLAAGAYSLSPGLRAGTVDLLQGMDRRAEVRQSAEAVPTQPPAPEDALLPPAATDAPTPATAVPLETDAPAATELPATEPPQSGAAGPTAPPAATDEPIKAAAAPSAAAQTPAKEERRPAPPVPTALPEPTAPASIAVTPEATIPAEEDMPVAVGLVPEPPPVPAEDEAPPVTPEPPAPEESAAPPEETQEPVVPEEEDVPTAIGLTMEDRSEAPDAAAEDGAAPTPAPEQEGLDFDPEKHVPEGYALAAPEGEPSPAPVPGRLEVLYTGPAGETVRLELTAVTDGTAPDRGPSDADPGEAVAVGQSLATLTDRDGERRICWLDETRQLWVCITASDMTREQLIAYAGGLFPAA